MACAVTRAVSLNTKVQQITGLTDTDLASDREIDFVRSLPTKTRDGQDTTGLSEKQVDWIESIWDRNFA